MTIYTYKARNRQGELINGSFEAEDERSVAANLDRLGYSVIEVIPKGGGLSFSLAGVFGRFQCIHKQEVIVFTRQLATLIHSGMALSHGLATICEQTTNKKFKLILENVCQSVQQGTSFSETLSRYPAVFPELFVSMIEVGEAGGMLDKVLDRLAALGIQELDISSRIKSALMYPIVLVVVAFLIVNFLMVGVLPKFVMVFRASQASLPLPTQIVLGLSWILRKLWFPILVCLGLAGLWFRSYLRRPEGKFKFHNWMLGLPIFGKLYNKVQISRFARTLSALTSSGITLLHGLMVVEKTITNVVIRKEIQNIRIAISEGRPLVEPFKASSVFSPMVVQMISTGEKSGKLDQVLEEIAGFYDPEIEYTIKNLTALLEPFMLLAMGIMVAFIALSVLLPIFNLIKVFRG
ncbi:MAG: type II secretion system F family protein [Candidatus Omnitrophica bacterium]|nr:type II secretion system F family protein [Candidatus Omnitrophota bacterium]